MISSTSSDFPADLSQSDESSSDGSIRNGFIDENICGEGASCIVYRMRWQGFRVAVKRLRAEYLLNANFVSSYRKEFQLGQQLKHDGLPIYREPHFDPDEVYVVMDYVDGISLSDFLDKDEGKQYFSSEANVKRFLSQLLDVVAYLHRSGIVHCDIKPANIMLRRSDRGVMLIDLDKAYSDSLDRTHGGTSSMSDPMSSGETPTVAKDFIAIGNLIDYISEKVSGFPKRQFRKLLRECWNPKANDDSIVQSLEARSYTGALITGAVSLCLLAGVFYYFGNQIVSTEETKSVEVKPTVVSDTVRVIEVKQPQSIESPVAVPAKHKAFIVDFDKLMVPFIQDVNGALTALRNGELSDAEIRNKLSEIVEFYTSKYQEILNTCKSENPDMSGIDLEMAVAKASERSQTTKLFQQFTQAAADTLTNREIQLK